MTKMARVGSPCKTKDEYEPTAANSQPGIVPGTKDLSDCLWLQERVSIAEDFWFDVECLPQALF